MSDDYQGNVSLHEAAHAALCILYEIPFQRVTCMPGSWDNGKKYGGCLFYYPDPDLYPPYFTDAFHTYPQDRARGLGARTEISLLSKDQILQSIHQIMVGFAGAVSEEMDYFGTGKATEWGPTEDFKDIRFRIRQMDYLVRTDHEAHFEELYNEARRLFKDYQGDPTILWLRTIAIGKVLWRMKNLSEGNCRKLYNDVKPTYDRRMKKIPDEWPKLRFNVDEENQKIYHKGV